jgi:hypothetical protein
MNLIMAAAVDAAGARADLEAVLRDAATTCRTLSAFVPVAGFS